MQNHPAGEIGKLNGGHSINAMRVRRMRIDTYQEPVVYMRGDSEICRAEGFEAMSRIEVWYEHRRMIATLNVVNDPNLLHDSEIGFSEAAWLVLGAPDGAEVTLSHPQPLHSFSHVRAKLFGKPFDPAAARDIMRDVVAGDYSDIEIATFLAACAASRVDIAEMTALTRAMVETGDRIDWGKHPVVDKHCVGGLPGNRTTLLVVPIVAACGLVIPKTSSRAITSPAGTADTMETLAPVSLDLSEMRRVVEQEGGCVAWGGAVNLSPADDLLIRIERPLDIDSDSQLVASVLSKKIAAGSSHVLIDIPVGPTAKVRNEAAARHLAGMLAEVGTAFGVAIRTVVTDGSRPVGRGIGPALEARDVVGVLTCAADAPQDLRRRALLLASLVIEMGKGVTPEQAMAQATDALDSGKAWRKFQAICEAQGGMREPPAAAYTHTVCASRAGRIGAVDNRRLARIAKLAGAPKAPAAGLDLHRTAGDQVWAGEPVFTIHAQTPGELAYAKAYAAQQEDVIHLDPLSA